MSIFIGFLILIALAHVYLHFTNPYAKFSIFKSPYTTYINDAGNLAYTQNYKLKVYGSRLAGLLGYYKGGLLIIQNTIIGGKRSNSTTELHIIRDIHRMRFDPKLPYLISGDQFSVLYPRNLGVFYNQILDPDTALDSTDWEYRQRIYVQSVLIAIDGLSASCDPRTTVIPIGTKSAVLTQVHPGGIGSDQVYGLLYAIDQLGTKRLHHNSLHKTVTIQVAAQICKEKAKQLTFIVESYVSRVQDTRTTMIKANTHMASARDGIIRSSSLYDNIVLWKTLQLADKLGVYPINSVDLDQLGKTIKHTFWNQGKGFYNDDLDNKIFSADWLIGFPTGFFNLQEPNDLAITEQIVSYIEKSNLVKPFPIKYQETAAQNIPFFVKLIVPAYGGTTIWSYWGAQYITLLVDLYEHTSKTDYLFKARVYQKLYAQKIVEDQGFAETFDDQGKFLRNTIYKSIRITGWVVQYEHAKQRIQTYDNIVIT